MGFPVNHQALPHHGIVVINETRPALATARMGHFMTSAAHAPATTHAHPESLTEIARPQSKPRGSQRAEALGRAMRAADVSTASVNDVSAKGRVPRKRNVPDDAKAPPMMQPIHEAWCGGMIVSTRAHPAIQMASQNVKCIDRAPISPARANPHPRKRSER